MFINPKNRGEGKWRESPRTRSCATQGKEGNLRRELLGSPLQNKRGSPSLAKKKIKKKSFEEKLKENYKGGKEGGGLDHSTFRNH